MHVKQQVLGLLNLQNTNNAAKPEHRMPGSNLPPVLGWNTWNFYYCDISEQVIKDNAELIIKYGLADAGYNYINIDDCWALRERDNVTKRMVPDPKKFPSGMKALADWVHSKGLKFGIYSDSGSRTCADYPGSRGYEDIDAQTWAEWGVDYLKYDNCYTPKNESQVIRYTDMSVALSKVDRSIFYSLCNWGNEEVWKWGSKVGDSWRISGDISDRWDSAKEILDITSEITQYSGPDGFNDMDMLEVGNGGMTTVEYISHFSFWAALKSPLLIGTNLKKIKKEHLEILLNEDVIAVNQDALRISAKKYDTVGNLEIWGGPLSDGFVVLVLNASKEKVQAVVPLSMFGIEGGIGKNLWTKEHYESSKWVYGSIEPHGTLMVKIKKQ